MVFFARPLCVRLSSGPAVTDLIRELATTVGAYATQAIEAAQAEAAHKSGRARRCLQAKHSGEAKSAAEAEWVGDSDQTVADLLARRLITAAVADATKQRILSLREAVNYERSLMADRRAADTLHATDRRIT